MSIEVSKGPDATRLTLEGEIDLNERLTLERNLLEELGTDCDRLEVEARDVTFIDSAGLDLLIRLNRLCAQHGGHMVIRQPSEVLRKVIDLTGLTEWITVEP
jgi:anti-sigma B factor antagonist